MNIGPSHPSGSGGGKGRRRRGRRGPGARPGQQPNGGGGAAGGRGNRPQQQRDRDGIFTRPMDHNYSSRNGQQSRARRGGTAPLGYVHSDPEPLVHKDENAAPKIFALVDDLFFTAKIQETARKLNVKVEFVKGDKEILERVQSNGHEKPSLIILDLNNVNVKPLTAIPKLKKELKKGTAIIGFLSHIQGDLKIKAQEAGCDMVLPRSAFSQNLPSLLRRHGASDDDV